MKTFAQQAAEALQVIALRASFWERLTGRRCKAYLEPQPARYSGRCCLVKHDGLIQHAIDVEESWDFFTIRFSTKISEE